MTDIYDEYLGYSRKIGAAFRKATATFARIVTIPQLGGSE